MVLLLSGTHVCERLGATGATFVFCKRRRTYVLLSPKAAVKPPTIEVD